MRTLAKLKSRPVREPGALRRPRGPFRLTSAGRSTIPQRVFDGLSVYRPQRQGVRVAQIREFQGVASVADNWMYREDLATERDKVAYLGTSSTAEELVDAGALNGGVVVWSLWPGYLDHPFGQRLTDGVAEADVLLTHHHTSSHGQLEDHAGPVDAFSTAGVVPIHSEATERFVDHFPRVEAHADHAWSEV